MKILITAQGRNSTDAVDQRFGRASYHIIHDTEADTYAAIDNAAQLNAAQGAGVQAAQNAVAGGAEAVLTGHCGPKAFDVLAAAGVSIYSGITGTVVDAVGAWKRDELEQLSGPDGTPSH